MWYLSFRLDSIPGRSIVVDSQGNSCVTGYFNGTANLSSLQLAGYRLNDKFVAKYNFNGS